MIFIMQYANTTDERKVIKIDITIFTMSCYS